LASLGTFFLFLRHALLILNQSSNEFGFPPFSHIPARLSQQKCLPIFSVIEVAKNKNGVIKMETKLKDRLIGKGLSGMIKNVEAIYQRITKISVKASRVDVVGFSQRETSKEYQAHLAEVQCEQAQALAETRNGLSRC